MSARRLASLSSSLLARPGQAKPAMRPQPFAYAPVEDLGWNDMGNEPGMATPAPAAVPAPAPAPASLPPVLTERAALARAVAAKPGGGGRLAAFTLRLSPERHLRLRLASAVEGRSAQQVVAAALDAFLADRPQVEALARQVATDSKPNSRGKTR